ncbi:hypothetical protein Lal_00023045 [Lupinus albus]|nr:hypothetical protein Lal_00023045 [Lupinus albus]
MNPILWEIPILTLVVNCWNRIGMRSQYCGYLELALEAIFLGVFENDSYSARAELFYPGNGVVDSLLAPLGSTTKRLKESDLVVTQPRAELFYPGDGVVDSLLAP